MAADGTFDATQLGAAGSAYHLETTFDVNHLGAAVDTFDTSHLKAAARTMVYHLEITF